ncbi:MAG TPA: hypothetical protein VH307_27335, partial [Streptosporangiaceae bacterium]|nr:hypothetical protein [Streptosporangiaceae bacterium]
MTHSEQEEILRRALHAVADTIEPAAGGLERIRERLSKPRPLAVAWLMVGWTGMAQPLLLRMEPAVAGAAGRLGSWLRLMLRSLETAAERLGPVAEQVRPAVVWLADAIRMLRPGSGMSRHEKLRAAIAFGAVAVIGTAGGFALSAGLPQQVISAASSAFSPGQPNHSGGPGHNAAGTGPGRTDASASGPATRPTPKPGRPTPTRSCTPKSQSSTTPSPTQGSPSPTPTPTPTPTQTPSGASAAPNAPAASSIALHAALLTAITTK